MPVQTTYPGVYIEEVPSPVHTIVGVSTSITAFIGYTARGPVNEPVHVYNYGDYQRAFGELDGDSPVSYAIQQFFQNGGIEAFVVRVAANAAAASVELLDKVGTGQRTVLTARAANAGVWGNDVLVTVDYAAANPTDQFNLTVVSYRQQRGALVVAATETYRNLSMNSKAANHAVDTVNAGSAILRLARPTGLTSADRGQAFSAILNEANVPYANIGPGKPLSMVAVSVDGKPTIEIPLPTPTGATNNDKLKSIGDAIRAAAPGLDTGFATVTGTTAATRQLQFRTANTGEDRSIRLMSASQNDAAATLGLGVLNGGRETDGSASLRPAESGTVGTDQSGLNLSTLTTDQTVDLTIDRAVRADTGPIAGLVVSKGADGPPATLEVLRARIEAALQGAASTNLEAADELTGARVLLVDNHFQVIPSGPGDSVVKFTNPATFGATLGWTGTSRQNVGLYRLGVGPTLDAQANAVPGADGTPPSAGDIRGNESARTGIYALQDVDLFNILCLPGQSDNTLLAEAMTYCERRRAFLIVDVPKNVDTLVEAQNWITQQSTPKSKNAAAYFPWVILPDPLQDYRPQAFPPSGMLAGLYARMDGTRGVWKAPAGTDAVLRFAQGVAYNLSDPENGALNPLGLNSIRSLRVYGIVSWGARTLEGSDQQASEWKYIPVRRMALFIEESLYRGTQWVVFEPNDEPLWAQIRLNVGAFMHNLFRQGAFQGKTPARGLPRQVRQRDDHAERHRSRNRQHSCRIRPAEAR